MVIYKNGKPYRNTKEPEDPVRIKKIERIKLKGQKKNKKYLKLKIKPVVSKWKNQDGNLHPIQNKLIEESIEVEEEFFKNLKDVLDK